MNITEANDFNQLLDFLFGPRRPGTPEATITQASVAASRLAERAHRALGTGRRDHDVAAMFERLRPGIAVQPPVAAIAYGVAPEVFDGEDVLTAQQLWAAIREQFDPNDAWEIEEITPLLRTFLAVLTRRRAANRQLVKQLRADLAGAHAAIGRLQASPDPAVEPTARQLVDLWDRLSDGERLNLAARILAAVPTAAAVVVQTDDDELAESLDIVQVAGVSAG